MTRWLLMALACLALLGQRPAQALTLREAQLQAAGQAGWQPVALPDTWPAGPGGATQAARYRLSFPLDAAPRDVLWGLRIDRLSSVHRLYLNGHLVHAQGGGDDTRLRLLPLYLPLPPTLLRAGDNELRLELQFGTRAGLSTVQLGPDAPLRAAFDADRRLDTHWPQTLNLIGAGLAACMLLLWARRRQERATGLFGALWLIASLRNVDYFATSSSLPAGVSDWLYFCAQCCTVALLGLFAVELSGRPWPWLRRAYLGALLGLPLLGGAAQLLGGFVALRLAVYPLLMGALLGALWVLARLLRRQRGLALALLLCGVVLLVAAGAHDYAYLHGWVPVTHFYWQPYAIPLALSGYAAMLMNRLVRALARAEDLSVALERRVAERTAELAAANAAKTRFLAAASHDLRQPVAAIGLLAGLARERLGATAGAAGLTLLDKLERAALALEDLLRGLLDLSRLDAGAAAPRPQPVALQPLFDAIALHEQPHAQARGLRLRFRPTRAVVRSDPQLLEQMLRNLVANALRYTERGGVLVGVRRRGGELRLQVWDSGRGIAPQHRQQIFDEFVQLDPHRHGRHGLGLGLAIVQRGAALLGHGLGLTSREGRGSCFWVALQPAQAAAGRVAPARPASRPLAGRRVWLLEDDDLLREALAERLRDWGADVLALASLAQVRAALAAAAAPAVLLTDHRLSDGDGAQAIALIVERHGDVSAVLMSGEGGGGADALADYAVLGVPVLHKPFRAEALLPLLS